MRNEVIKAANELILECGREATEEALMRLELGGHPTGARDGQFWVSVAFLISKKEHATLRASDLE